MKMRIMAAAVVAMLIPLGAAAAPVSDHRVDYLVRGLDQPWALCFLPGGEMLITELSGQLRLIRDGRLVEEPIAGVPEVYFAGQGGLMDVVAHPDYEQNGWIYLSFSAGGRSSNATRVVRGRFTGERLVEVEEIFSARPDKDTSVHYGSRMAFLPDGTLLVTLGDGFDYREEAQNLGSHLGKIVRLTDGGGVPFDNPFRRREGVLPEIWSYGHRNVQAIVVDGAGRVFSHEHGPQGGDEVNMTEGGKNYGWPVITYGRDYSGAMISPWTERVGMEQPIWKWSPSIAPAGMAIYGGDLFPEWRGDLFVTSLVFGHIERLELEGEKVVRSEVIFKDSASRLRDIRVGPSGALYVLSDGGDLLRIMPK